MPHSISSLAQLSLNAALKLVGVLSIGLGLHGCASVKPTAPAASYAAPLQKVTEPSVFNIPIEVTAAELQRQVNTQVPATLYDDNSLDNNGGDNLIVKVSKRAPMVVSTSNGVLMFKVPIAMYVKAGWKTTQFGITLSKYEDTSFELDLNFATKVSVDPSWAIRTTTASNGYAWVSKPVLKLGGFEIPLTTVVEKVIDYQLPEITKLIDDQVSKNLDIKPLVQSAWNTLQQPILLNKELDAWLKIRPHELVMTPLQTKGNNLRFALGLKAETETHIGNAPAKDAAGKIPNLKVASSINEAFQVSLTSLVSYATITRLAKEQAVGKTFEEGKRKITITGLDVYGKDEKLVVAVDMTGSITGRIFLMGKPVYDPSTTRLILQEVDYSLETRSSLAKTADWLMHGTFVKMMTPYFQVSVAEQLGQARKAVQDNLNRPVSKGVVLSGKLDKLEPDQVRITTDGVQAIIKATGSLQVLVDGL